MNLMKKIRKFLNKYDLIDFNRCLDELKRRLICHCFYFEDL